MDNYRDRAARDPSANDRKAGMMKAIGDWELKEKDIQFKSIRIQKEAKKSGLKPNKEGKFTIGKGGFGAIFLVEHSHTLAAMKVLEAHESEQKEAESEFIQELELLMRIRHPNIILYLGGASTGGEFFFLTELMENDLCNLIAKKDPRSQWDDCGKFYARDVCAALAYLHGKNMVHKDVKSGNILINGQVAKLADFGLAKQMEDTLMRVTMNRAYSAAWASPEQLNPSAIVTFPTDIYSFAIVIWEMLTGTIPWEGLNNLQMMFATAQGQFKEHHVIPKNTPVTLAVNLHKCWLVEGDKRPTAEKLLSVLDDLV